MDYVSFATAIKLKQNGFKDPAVKPGQCWANEDGERIRYIGHFTHRSRMSFWGWVFCPNATDILREMRGCSLAFIQGDCWGVFTVGGKKMIGFHPDNPAEACADAWLSLHKPQ